MVQLKSVIFITVTAFAVLISGCTSGQDVTPIVKALPEVQQFLNEHPNAKITVTYWSKEDVAKFEQEISQQCDKPITPAAMYKAVISEGDIKSIAWIDAATQTLICSTTEGKGGTPAITPTITTSTPTLTPMPTTTQTYPPIPTVTFTPYPTPTVTPTSTPEPAATPGTIVNVINSKFDVSNIQINVGEDFVIYNRDDTAYTFADMDKKTTNITLVKTLIMGYYSPGYYRYGLFYNSMQTPPSLLYVTVVSPTSPTATPTLTQTPTPINTATTAPTPTSTPYTLPHNKTMTVGETWDLGRGYTLTTQSIDALASPRQVWIVFSKDGVKLDDKVISEGYAYTYGNIFSTKIASIFRLATGNGAMIDAVRLENSSLAS